MRSNPTGSVCLRMPKAGIFLLSLIASLSLLGAFSGQSKASPVSLKFDNGRLTIGSIFDNKVILPATSTFPSDSLPTPQRTDIQLEGDLTGGKLSFPASTNTGLQFPYMHLMHPLERDLKIPITFRLNNPGLNGTWNEKTGAMSLTGKLDIIVVTGTGTNFPIPDDLTDTGTPPLGLLARCRIDDVPVKFSTANKIPTTAQPFTGGFGIHGAITTTWDHLPKAKSENGGDCGDLNMLLNFDGGIWLSNGIVKPIPQPKPQESCETDLSLCPMSKFVEIDDVRLRPGRKSVRPGSKLTLTVKVHNSGNLTARKLKVRIKSSSRSVRVPKFVTLRVPAGRYGRKKFHVKVRRNATGRVRITAIKNGWPGRTLLKIRSKKKVGR